MFDPLVRTEKKPGASLTAATTLTAEDSGRCYELNGAAGVAFTTTLPALVANGPIMEFEFIVGIAPTTNNYIITTPAADNDKLNGLAFSSTGGDANSVTDAGADLVNLVVNVALIGDRVVVKSNPAGTRWYAYAWTNADAAATFTG